MSQKACYITSIKSTCNNISVIRVNKASNIFVTNFGGVKVYLLNNTGNDHMLMSEYFKDIGLPTFLQMDNSKEVDMNKK